MATTTTTTTTTTSKVKATMAIKDFVEELGKEPGEYLQSDTFLVGEAPMRVWVYPNGVTEVHRGRVEVGLRNMDGEEVRVKARMKKPRLEGPPEDRNTVLRDWLYLGYLTHDTCRERYEERDFMLTMVVEVAEEAPVPRQQKSLRQEVAEKAFQEMALTDFSLVFEGEEVRCHRVILAGVSPVLAAMVRNEHQEVAEARAFIQVPAAVGKAFVR